MAQEAVVTNPFPPQIDKIAYSGKLERVVQRASRRPGIYVTVCGAEAAHFDPGARTTWLVIIFFLYSGLMKLVKASRISPKKFKNFYLKLRLVNDEPMIARREDRSEICPLGTTKRPLHNEERSVL